MATPTGNETQCGTLAEPQDAECRWNKKVEESGQDARNDVGKVNTKIKLYEQVLFGESYGIKNL